MIRVTNLCVAVKKKDILNGVSLKVDKGEIVVLFGPNGSGKTTLLNTIMGLGKYQVKSGWIKFKGEKINNWPVEKRAKAGIGLLWQKPPKVAGVRLAEIIKVIGENKRNGKATEELVAGKFLNRGVNEDLSGGELKRSELLQLLVQDPQLLLLDEPDSGVDVENSKLIAELIESWRKKGKSILLVTHSGNLLKYLSANRAYVMLDGEIRCQGKPAEILEAIAKCGYRGCVDCNRRQKNGRE
jgi:Fe-S cluster assembly ATP-binding protein